MHLVFLTPHPEPQGGGRDFNAGLVPALRALGHEVTVAHDLTSPLPVGALPVVDGMVLPALEPGFDAVLAHDPIAVIHHVSAAAGRDAARRDAIRAAEARMLPRIRRVVATSAPVAERLHAEFGVASPHILHPGLPDLPRSLTGPCRILCAAVLTPRKGHDRLLRALARLTDLDWTLILAGDAQRDPAHARTIDALLDELDLRSRVTILQDPASASLDAAWQDATLFALASRWEGWPAAVAEALRRGIPVVALETPGITTLVPPSAGIVCAPGDEATWGKALRRAIYDTELRATLAEGAWTAGAALPGWPAQAAAFATLLEN